VFPSGSEPGDLYIINPAENAFDMQVEIVLDDTGEVIYQSGILHPNQHIASDRLLRVLPAGSYNATATIISTDPQEPERQINRATASLLITVQS